MAIKRRSNAIFLFAFIALLGGMFTNYLPYGKHSASAQALPLDVVVTITHVMEIGDLENPICGEPDFFSRVWINNVDKGESPTIDGNPDIYPDWQFTESVNLSDVSVPVKIEVWEDDNGVCGFDDQGDLDPIEGDGSVDIMVDLAPCLVSGDIFGACDLTFSRQGAGDNAVLIEFTIDVVEPAYGPNLRVRCSTDSIFPQIGEEVQITAESVDSLGSVRLADHIEIWVDTTPEMNDAVAPFDSKAGRVSFSTTTDPLTGDFAYGCRLKDDGLVAWSGWRTVTVGEVDEDATVIPVQITGPRSSRVDILLIADETQYTSALDPMFLGGASRIVKAFWDFDLYAQHQNQFNFWIALETGEANDGGDGDCDHSGPRPSWVDAGMIIHDQPTRAFKNCVDTDKHLGSATTARPSSVVHETGHTPFGLADEYDDGGFWQSRHLPNVYLDLADYYVDGRLVRIGCATGALQIGKTVADCRPIHDGGSWWLDPDRTWYTTDLKSDDVMVSGNTAHELDIRRIEWFFVKCTSAQC